MVCSPTWSRQLLREAACVVWPVVCGGGAPTERPSIEPQDKSISGDADLPEDDLVPRSAGDEASVDADGRLADCGAMWKCSKTSGSRSIEIEPGAVGHLATLARERRWEVIFPTKRPESGGDTVQLQTQRWLEAKGFMLPSVFVVQGSRGLVADALASTW